MGLVLLRKGSQCFIGPMFILFDPPTCQKETGVIVDNFRPIRSNFQLLPLSLNFARFCETRLSNMHTFFFSTVYNSVLGYTLRKRKLKIRHTKPSRARVYK